jgi:hypothetical protein
MSLLITIKINLIRGKHMFLSEKYSHYHYTKIQSLPYQSVLKNTDDTMFFYIFSDKSILVVSKITTDMVAFKPMISGVEQPCSLNLWSLKENAKGYLLTTEFIAVYFHR